MSRVNFRIRLAAGPERCRNWADDAMLVTHVLKCAISSIRDVVRRGEIANEER